MAASAGQPPGHTLPTPGAQHMSLTTRALLAIGLVVGAGICALTGQEAPAEVYLVSDVNAWVADRGGMPGFGARRVMRLGPPLLQTLSIAELRAVLAHELGHFFAGDPRLGSWIHRTRPAIAHTLESLHGSLLQKPFIAYAKLFLRISHAVSRKQEYAADALAARTVGARPFSPTSPRVLRTRFFSSRSPLRRWSAVIHVLFRTAWPTTTRRPE